MSGKTAIIIGATGMVGKQVLALLLESTAYQHVIALSRRSMSISHPKLKNMVIDFDHLAEELKHIHADDAFCCLGTTIKQAGTKAAFHKVDYTYNFEFAHTLKQNGCQHFLLISALGAFPKSLVFYSRVKGLLEKDISALKFTRLSIFRPSLLLGERAENRLGENLAANLFPLISPFLRGGLRAIQPIQGAVVANAMVSIAQQPPTSDNPHFYYYDEMMSA
ncbi:oxidoreductase [Agitococcus lubricus]|uniref:Putative NAD(P)-binding protein n=1 Tax=Agitococcus lubricus TaxID=1077255 RepID=A0A2T5IWS5_9GAMM|nr:oxidoreductase [Agitococcus lubricus]PTQ88387.1 putative NAD(P)-binding protein [Agitococcus lubricus]